MKYSQSEKMEIIRMVEESNLSVKKTLEEMDVPRSSFYSWYKRYLEFGYEGLASRRKRRRQFWNAIPEWEKERVVKAARQYPEKSCRDLLETQRALPSLLQYLQKFLSSCFFVRNKELSLVNV